MHFNVFKLEDYYAKHEFITKYMLSSSDAESWFLNELLDLATSEEKLLWDSQRLGYIESQGSLALRRIIAQQLYPGLNEENILCLAGAQEGILCGLIALCKPTDHVIVLTPCYQSLLEVPSVIGSEITTLELKEENDWRIDINAIKESIQPNTKCVIINFPHNPTGSIITNDELIELITVLEQRDIILFSDEVYRLLGMPKDRWADPVACLYKKGISLGVMSKAFGMPGLRIGWIACRDQEILQKIAKNRYYTTICNSGPSEILSLIALRNKDFLLERNNAIVTSNLGLLEDFFKKYSNYFSWVRPQAGCIGFVKYKGSELVDSLCDRAAKQASTLLLPSSVYNVVSNHFRIGFGRKNMPEALVQFEQFILNERTRP